MKRNIDTFTALAPVNGALGAAAVNAGLDGLAQTSLTLGSSTGTYKVKANCPGCIAGAREAVFTATAVGTEWRCECF